MFENELHLMNCSFCSNFQTNRCLQRSYILLYVVFQNPVNHISHNPPQNFTNNYGSHTMICYIYIYIYIYILCILLYIFSLLFFCFYIFSFLPRDCKFIKAEALAQVFSCEFYEISKNSFFTGNLRWLLLKINFWHHFCN